MRPILRLIALGLTLVWFFPKSAQGEPPAQASKHPEAPVFEKDIRPVLKAYCLDCHGATEKLGGKLDLRLKKFALRGGKSGPALVLGQPMESLLTQRMRSGEMPPGEKKVPPEMIALVESWIARGAPTLRSEPDGLPPGLGITAEERSFWFYQPLKSPPLPRFGPGERVRTPIDAFIWESLKKQGLAFQNDADRATLIRRATLDLTGLPPTLSEIESFVRDSRPDAYEKLLDRLLASPAYGERWARHWLDAVGYADSDGDGANDTIRPHSWRYRDYVIRSLNEDKPWDRFIQEQLAGDEMVPRPWKEFSPKQVELLAATGFLRTAPDGTSSQNNLEQAEMVLADTLKVVSSALLGSSLGCAQCHDHRYDPIPQKDYFQIRAIFEPALDPASWRTPGQRNQSLFTEADRAKSAAIEAEVSRLQGELSAKQTAAVKAIFEKEIGKFPEAERAALKAAFETPAEKRTPPQKKLVDTHPKLMITPGVIYQFDTKLDEEIKAIAAKIDAKRKEKPVEPFVSIATENPGRIPPTKLHHRGDYRQPIGPELEPADLTIASEDGKRATIPQKDPQLPTTGRRLAWAKELTRGDHPLFNRVQANRIWLHHFGKGLVDTPGEFGRLGQLPSHPELLDYLALEWPKLGWSLKRFHKLIMTSTVYRQGSKVQAADPANLAYSRYPLRRLQAEELRDRVLFVTGRLDMTPFGPPVSVVEDPTGQTIAPEDRPRRSIYLQLRRSKPIGFLAAFDLPVGELKCDRRVVATSPQQSLALMNGEFIRNQARHLANRVVRETSDNLVLEGAEDPSWSRPASLWSYGFGGWDERSGRVTFEPFLHFTGSQWQGGPQLPDSQKGWAMIHAQGGHCGNDANHAAIRRWTAPFSGTVEIQGGLGHHSPHGDGVRGRVFAQGNRCLGEWVVKNETKPVALTFSVQQGDRVDLMVDCRGDVTSDSFTWPVKIVLRSGNHQETFNAPEDFQGPQTSSLAQRVAMAWRMIYQRSPSRDEIDLACRFLKDQLCGREGTKKRSELEALTNLCQQLLASNEFLYVD